MIERCSCGGRIRADLARPTPGVAAHNRTVRHQDWRALKEYAEYIALGELEKFGSRRERPTAPPRKGDLSPSVPGASAAAVGAEHEDVA